MGGLVLMLTCDVVSRWIPPCQLPPLGVLNTSGISVMVSPGAGWTWVCHVFPRWILWPLPPLLHRRLLLVHDVYPVDTASDHGGAMVSFTGGGSRVAQYRDSYATSVPV